MRSLVLYQLMSLDGVAEEPGDWMFQVDPDVFEFLGQVIAQQDDVLLGRGTYDYWVDYWPTSAVEPFATFINTVPKHVFTSSALPGRWPGTHEVRTDPRDHVRWLKASSGRDIGIHGSKSLARTLLQARLVDRLCLVVAPTLAGRGDQLFGGLPEGQSWSLAACTRTPSGTLLLDYGRRPGAAARSLP